MNSRSTTDIKSFQSNFSVDTNSVIQPPTPWCSTVKWGAHNLFDIKLSNSIIYSCFPLTDYYTNIGSNTSIQGRLNDFIAITSNSIIRIDRETKSIKEIVKQAYCAGVYIPIHDAIVAISATTSHFVFIKPEDLKHPIESEFRCLQFPCFHITFLKKSHVLITSGNDIRIWDLKCVLPSRNTVTMKPKIDIKLRATIDIGYELSYLNPPCIDYLNEYIILPKSSGFSAYNVDGQIIKEMTRLPTTKQTFASFLPNENFEDQNKLKKLSNQKTSQKLYYQPSINSNNTTSEKKDKKENIPTDNSVLITADSGYGVCEWTPTGTIKKRHTSGNSNIISIRLINKSFFLYVDIKNNIYIVDMLTRTPRMFLVATTNEKPLSLVLFRTNSVASAFQFGLALCINTTISVYQVVVPWKLFAPSLVKPQLIKLCPRMNRAARIQVQTSNSDLYLLSPKTAQPITSAAPNNPKRIIDTLYDRGLWAKEARDQLIIVVENGEIVCYGTSNIPCEQITTIDDHAASVFLAYASKSIFNNNSNNSSYNANVNENENNSENKNENKNESINENTNVNENADVNGDKQLCYCVATQNGEILLRDYDSFKCVKRFIVQIGIVKTAKYDANYGTVIISYLNMLIRFDINNGVILEKLKQVPSGVVTALEKGLLLVGYESGKINMVRIREKKMEIMKTEGVSHHTAAVTGFSFGSNFFLSSSLDQQIKIWSLKGETLGVIQLPLPLYGIEIYNGKRDILVGTDKEIMVIEGKSIFMDEFERKDEVLDNYNEKDDELTNEGVSPLKKQEEEKQAFLISRKSAEPENEKKKKKNEDENQNLTLSNFSIKKPENTNKKTELTQKKEIDEQTRKRIIEQMSKMSASPIFSSRIAEREKIYLEQKTQQIENEYKQEKEQRKLTEGYQSLEEQELALKKRKEETILRRKREQEEKERMLREKKEQEEREKREKKEREEREKREKKEREEREKREREEKERKEREERERKEKEEQERKEKEERERKEKEEKERIEREEKERLEREEKERLERERLEKEEKERLEREEKERLEREEKERIEQEEKEKREKEEAERREMEEKERKEREEKEKIEKEKQSAIKISPPDENPPESNTPRMNQLEKQKKTPKDPPKEKEKKKKKKSKSPSNSKSNKPSPKEKNAEKSNEQPSPQQQPNIITFPNVLIQDQSDSPQTQKSSQTPTSGSKPKAKSKSKGGKSEPLKEEDFESSEPVEQAELESEDDTNGSDEDSSKTSRASSFKKELVKWINNDGKVFVQSKKGDYTDDQGRLFQKQPNGYFATSDGVFWGGPNLQKGRFLTLKGGRALDTIGQRFMNASSGKIYTFLGDDKWSDSEGFVYAKGKDGKFFTENKRKNWNGPDGNGFFEQLRKPKQITGFDGKLYKVNKKGGYTCVDDPGKQSDIMSFVTKDGLLMIMVDEMTFLGSDGKIYMKDDQGNLTNEDGQSYENNLPPEPEPPEFVKKILNFGQKRKSIAELFSRNIEEFSNDANEEEKKNVNEKEKQNVNEEEKQNVNEEEKQNVNEEEKQNVNEEEKQNVNEEEKQNVNEEEKQNVNDEEKQNVNDEEKQNVNEEEKQNVNDEEKQNVNEEEKQNVNDEEKQNVNEEEKQNVNEEEKQNENEEEKQSVNGEEKQNVNEEEKQNQNEDATSSKDVEQEHKKNDEVKESEEETQQENLEEKENVINANEEEKEIKPTEVEVNSKNIEEEKAENTKSAEEENNEKAEVEEDENREKEEKAEKEEEENSEKEEKEEDEEEKEKVEKKDKEEEEEEKDNDSKNVGNEDKEEDNENDEKEEEDNENEDKEEEDNENDEKEEEDNENEDKEEEDNENDEKDEEDNENEKEEEDNENEDKEEEDNENEKEEEDNENEDKEEEDNENEDKEEEDNENEKEEEDENDEKEEKDEDDQSKGNENKVEDDIESNEKEIEEDDEDKSDKNEEDEESENESDDDEKPSKKFHKKTAKSAPKGKEKKKEKQSTPKKDDAKAKTNNKAKETVKPTSSEAKKAAKTKDAADSKEKANKKAKANPISKNAENKENSKTNKGKTVNQNDQVQKETKDLANENVQKKEKKHSKGDKASAIDNINDKQDKQEKTNKKEAKDLANENVQKKEKKHSRGDKANAIDNSNDKKAKHEKTNKKEAKDDKCLSNKNSDEIASGSGSGKNRSIEDENANSIQNNSEKEATEANSEQNNSEKEEIEENNDQNNFDNNDEKAANETNSDQNNIENDEKEAAESNSDQNNVENNSEKAATDEKVSNDEDKPSAHSVNESDAADSANDEIQSNEEENATGESAAHNEVPQSTPRDQVSEKGDEEAVTSGAADGASSLPNDEAESAARTESNKPPPESNIDVFNPGDVYRSNDGSEFQKGEDGSFTDESGKTYRPNDEGEYVATDGSVMPLSEEPIFWAERDGTVYRPLPSGESKWVNSDGKVFSPSQHQEVAGDACESERISDADEDEPLSFTKDMVADDGSVWKGPNADSGKFGGKKIKKTPVQWVTNDGTVFVPSDADKCEWVNSDNEKYAKANENDSEFSLVDSDHDERWEGPTAGKGHWVSGNGRVIDSDKGVWVTPEKKVYTAVKTGYVQNDTGRLYKPFITSQKGKTTAGSNENVLVSDDGKDQLKLGEKDGQFISSTGEIYTSVDDDGTKWVDSYGIEYSPRENGDFLISSETRQKWPGPPFFTSRKPKKIPCLFKGFNHAPVKLKYPPAPSLPKREVVYTNYVVNIGKRRSSTPLYKVPPLKYNPCATSKYKPFSFRPKTPPPGEAYGFLGQRERQNKLRVSNIHAIPPPNIVVDERQVIRLIEDGQKQLIPLLRRIASADPSKRLAREYLKQLDEKNERNKDQNGASEYEDTVEEEEIIGSNQDFRGRFNCKFDIDLDTVAPTPISNLAKNDGKAKVMPPPGEKQAKSARSFVHYNNILNPINQEKDYLNSYLNRGRAKWKRRNDEGENEENRVGGISDQRYSSSEFYRSRKNEPNHEERIRSISEHKGSSEKQIEIPMISQQGNKPKLVIPHTSRRQKRP